MALTRKTEMKAPRLTQKQKREIFFYAEAEAEMYDRTIDLVVPEYRLMHKTMIQLIKFHFGLKDGDSHSKIIKGNVFDLGSGTGMESIGILKKFPGMKITAFDLCEPMHEEFKKNFYKTFGTDADIDKSCNFLVGDFLEEKWEPDNLKALLNKEENGFDLVITAFTIHHFFREEKEEAYRRIFEILKPGGVLINGDLFKYESPMLTEFSKDYDNSWISEQFLEPDERFREACTIDKAKRERLRVDWLKHYKRDNILHSVEEQKKMLRDIGFSESGNPFNFWQVGILWAIKGNE